MNRRILGITAVLGVIGFAAAKLLGASKKLQFGQMKIRDKKFHVSLSKLGVTLIIGTTITNNSDTSLPYNGFDGSITYGKIDLASIIDTRSLMIKSKSETDMTFTVFIDFLKLGGQVVTAIKSGDFLNACYVVGNIKSAGVKFAVKSKVF